MVKVKICGLTNYRDAVDAIDCGADAIGFVLANSPRQITLANAKNIIGKLPPFVIKVGVFVNAPLEDVIFLRGYCGFNLIQLHGDEDKEYFYRLYPYALKVFRGNSPAVIRQINNYGALNFMLDSGYGGTGKVVNIRIARKAVKLGNMILAGGLTPDNVAEIVNTVKPYGVDVSSGVEKRPGKKDSLKMKAFIKELKD